MRSMEHLINKVIAPWLRSVDVKLVCYLRIKKKTKKNSQCTIMLLNILYIETFLNLPGDGNLLKALLHSIFGGICLYLSIYIAMRLHL